MAFVFLFLGALLVITAIRGTSSQAVQLLQSEFTGAGSFIPWVMALLILGAIGYIKPVKPIADAMMLLVLFTMFISSDKGFFTQFNQQISAGAAATTSSSASATGSATNTATLSAPAVPAIPSAPTVQFQDWDTSNG